MKTTIFSFLILLATFIILHLRYYRWMSHERSNIWKHPYRWQESL